ncbi:hypothetical protein AR1Y2_2396 [Anaerostipes rhamnosivorans]|uniref:Uncharacterized protein n=1 Tax=Anaerostipes rhamnosivorans TaxID=1229621 RepID=A0A4V1EGF0_9FIRM|nr:hypothetical protein AR1Y2_2396 [Anaerostipes rhamnosivorans]
MIPCRRSAILAERFLFHGMHFPMKQDRIPLVGFSACGGSL